MVIHDDTPNYPSYLLLHRRRFPAIFKHMFEAAFFFKLEAGLDILASVLDSGSVLKRVATTKQRLNILVYPFFDVGQPDPPGVAAPSGVEVAQLTS